MSHKKALYGFIGFCFVIFLPLLCFQKVFAATPITQSQQVDWESVKTSLTEHEKSRAYSGNVDTGKSKGKGKSKKVAEYKSVRSNGPWPDFDLGIYLGFGGTGSVMTESANLAQSLGRFGLDVMYGKIYFGVDVFGSIGAVVSSVTEVVGGAGGQLKFGFTTHHKYATSLYVIGLVEYLDYLTSYRKEILLGIGGGLKHKLKGQTSIFFECNAAFQVNSIGQNLPADSVSHIAAITMFGGLDFNF